MSHLRATLALAKQLTQSGVLKPDPIEKMNKMMLPLSKYLKYGLLTDDLIRDNEITKEALRRLPKDVFQERQYRLTRAISLSGNKDVLPQSEWTKPDEDVSYLKPFIAQVKSEIREKDEWNSGKRE